MIQYMKLSSAALDVVQGYNTFAHDLTHVLEDTLTGIQHTIGIIPIFSGKGGGGYLCIMPFGKGHMVMDNAIQRLRVYHPHATVEYASWLHSPLQTGIVVEQSLTESKFSNYLDEDHQYTYTDNKGNKSVGSLTELKNAHLEDGILLDTIENKIYFKGTKLNSKDITSQTTAIEILTMLLDHAGEDIKNTVFSPSTLTRQYNQMLGKIILPLRKLSKQYFGRELEIETHGTLREFTLTFHEKNISLGIIRKIA